MTGTVLNDGDFNGEQGRDGFCLQLSVGCREDVNQIIPQIDFTNVINTMMGGKKTKEKWETKTIKYRHYLHLV